MLSFPEWLPRPLVAEIPALLLITLVVLWAATSRRHWFLRALTVVAVGFMLLPTRAYDVILFVLLLAAFEFPLVWVYRRLIEPRLDQISLSKLKRNRPLRWLAGWLMIAAGCSYLIYWAYDEVGVSEEPLAWAGVFVTVVCVLLLAARRHKNLVAELILLARPVRIGTGWSRALLQFGLLDLLAAAAIAGGVTALVNQSISDLAASPAFIVAIAAIAACISTAVAYLIFGRRWWAKLVAGSVIGISFLLIDKLPGVQLNAAYGYFISQRWWQREALIFALATVAAGVMVACLLWRLIITGGGARPRLRSAAGAVAAVALLGLLSLNVLLYLYMLRPLHKPANIAASPSYQRLVKLAANVQAAGPAQQMKLLQEVRGLVREDTRAPIAYTESMDVDGIQNLRGLSRVLLAQGDAELLLGNADLAASYGIDCLWLGARSADRGRLIDRLIGCAIEGIAVDMLRRYRHDMSAESCQYAIRELRAVESQWEPYQNVLDRDRFWSWHSVGWVTWLEGYHGDGAWWYTVVNVEQRTQAMRRLLETELALVAYEEQHGTFPERLDVLLGTYLERMPIDPYDGRPLRYRRTDAGYDLYSVGENEQDDGGQRVSYGEFYSHGDLFLDIADFVSP